MESFTPEQKDDFEAGYRKMVNGLAMMAQGFNTIAVIKQSRLDRQEQAKRRKIMRTVVEQFRAFKSVTDAIRKRITWDTSKATIRAERRLAKLIEENFLDSWRAAGNPPSLAMGMWG